MSHLQPNCCLKIDFQQVDQYAGGKSLIHDTKRRKDNHQIPSIKVLFKANTRSHKHPSIKLLSSESKTQLVNQRKQKVAFNPGTAHSPEIQSYRMWWGAASPILNDAPVVCI